MTLYTEGFSRFVTSTTEADGDLADGRCPHESIKIVAPKLMPVVRHAFLLGVSDVALAKLCRRAAIPLPGRGYWQRTEAGQPMRPPALTPAPNGLPQLIEDSRNQTCNPLAHRYDGVTGVRGPGESAGFPELIAVRTYIVVIVASLKFCGWWIA